MRSKGPLLDREPSEACRVLYRNAPGKRWHVEAWSGTRRIPISSHPNRQGLHGSVTAATGITNRQQQELTAHTHPTCSRSTPVALAPEGRWRQLQSSRVEPDPCG